MRSPAIDENASPRNSMIDRLSEMRGELPSEIRLVMGKVVTDMLQYRYYVVERFRTLILSLK